jgi:hypothetical protein
LTCRKIPAPTAYESSKDPEEPWWEDRRWTDQTFARDATAS